MDVDGLQSELQELVSEFGRRPYAFFTILGSSDESGLDLYKQNERWAFVKSETWHSLDLSAYVLWSVSDNGDLLWWDGSQTIAMDHRASMFVSEPVAPRQFIRLAGMGKIGKVFPPLEPAGEV
jgi:hypothetical protein